MMTATYKLNSLEKTINEGIINGEQILIKMFDTRMELYKELENIEQRKKWCQDQIKSYNDDCEFIINEEKELQIIDNKEQKTEKEIHNYALRVLTLRIFKNDHECSKDKKIKQIEEYHKNIENLKIEEEQIIGSLSNLEDHIRMYVE
jgi:hypothetical protein